jgi:Domain of unknown function (DUF4149)
MVAYRTFRLLTMAWVGSLLTVGYLVAPILFTSLDRATAGSVAASLFRGEAMIGLVCGVLSLGLANHFVRRSFNEYRSPRGLVGAMLLCVLIGYFALQPFMNGLRMAALSAGTDVGHSAYASRFALLHGVSSGIYLIESLLGLVLIWRLPMFGKRSA